MRSYCVDDITSEQMAHLTESLTAMELGAGIEGLFWLPVPQQMLTETQQEHAEQCGPHCMALEVTEDSLRLELLVRARNMLRCACIGYASPELERHMIDYIDAILTERGSI